MLVLAGNNHLTLNPDDMEGTYYFVMSSTSKPNWTITAPSTGNLEAEQVTTQGNDNLFAIRSAGNGYYTIQNKQNGMYLTLGDVPDNEYCQVRNYVSQTDYTGADDQLWKITEDAGSYHIAAKSTRAKDGLQYLYCNGSTTVMAIGNSDTSALNYHEAQFHWNMVKVREFDFDKENSKLTYTPGDFMEYAETIYILVRVHENGFTASNIGTTDINNEVEMYKAVTVIPASVIYYEDDFPSIRYSGDTDQYTIDTDGKSAGLCQSNNQKEQYGHDDAYAHEFNVTASGNGSCHKVTINQATNMNEPAAWFEFTGTGFELISRTNAYDAATLFLRVMQDGEVKRLIPVITEFDSDANGDQYHDEEIYQVPVIKVDDLPYGKYTVQIIGVAAYDYSKDPAEIIPTILYIDGIRIFNPVGGGNVIDLENEYSATE